MIAMEEIVRLENISIEGIKNVKKGELTFEEYSNIQKGQFEELKSIIGIYGQNGSGKTTVLEATKILKTILTGEKLPTNINQYMNNETNKARITSTFFVRTQLCTQLITYTFDIESIDNQYDLVYEKMISKEYSYEENKWLKETKLFEVKNNEIIFKKLLNQLSLSDYVGLKVAKEIEIGSSFFFNKRNLNFMIHENKINPKLLDTLKMLNAFANQHLIIIENDLIGSINLSSFMPINLYVSNNDTLSVGEIPVDLLNPNDLPKDVFNCFKTAIEQIDIVLNAIVPTLNLEIINIKEQLLKNGEEGYTFEIASKREEKYIPLKYESEGIKRIISVTSALIALFNDSRVCLMIDEFDSGIFEYLLGELVQIIYESAKGQFVFTSHNLRALEKLPYKSILLTTTNAENRFIRLKNVKPNNNIRDLYYTSILLGGQEEILYNQTKNYKIKRAFRKASKLHE